MKVHLIAMGGSVMHNLALALQQKGFEVSGSDDAIYEPSKSRLENAGLLPPQMGWFPTKIHANLDAIILGMHARIDNPELKRAQELSIPIFSFPEYIYEQSRNKKRVVIGGSHGKTSITAMILHVLNYVHLDCDYLVGAQLEGFDTMVKLTHEAPVIILEGDEYLSSPIDLRPKFLWYKPHIAVISGIAWDHINVFPTFDNYVEQFRLFRKDVQDILFYFGGDKQLELLSQELSQCRNERYLTPSYDIQDGVTYFVDEQNRIPLQVFGKHNLQNIQAALLVCQTLGVNKQQFFEAIQSFKGAAKRLELIKKTPWSAIYKDFAHSPSKLMATTKAMKQQFPDRELVACMELHTFSSLNKTFLKEYEGTMNDADIAIVFLSQEALKHKKLEAISPHEIIQSFGREDLKVILTAEDLLFHLNSIEWTNKNLLMMSSGNFGGLDINQLSKLISDQK